MNSGISLVLFAVVLFGLMWFMNRAQRRAAKQHADLVARIAPGDEVVTLGGIYGTITEVEDGDTVLLEISEDTDIRVARSSIGRVVTRDAATPVDTDNVHSDPPAE